MDGVVGAITYIERISRGLFAAVLVGLATPAIAQPLNAQQDVTGWRSTLMFIQSGVTQDNTHSYTIGATWNWKWRREYSFAAATGYSEFSVGRWETPNGSEGGKDWVTQVGITPVIRLHPYSQFSNWFLEGGVGLNVILPVYRNDEKRFSTEFNFGDHIGIGREFGQSNQQEVVLRLQHFSNAGLKEPNPGENFLQFRYSSRY
ncbi:MAG TPA: acyloxyacyl hydrolase [Steroidobacteraceae bacterium]|jgi:hypothetical protein